MIPADFWTEGDTGVAILPSAPSCGKPRGCCDCCEGAGSDAQCAGPCWDCRGTGHPHPERDDVPPCGHLPSVKGCGGCDPGAGWVIDANGVVQLAPGGTDGTIFDRDLGERVPMVPRVLSLGVDPINQGRRYVMPGTLTIG